MAYDPQRQYVYFNDQYFGGELPHVEVRWSLDIPNDVASSHFHGVTRCVKRYCGENCKSSFILLNGALKLHELWCVADVTLLHEMGHAKCLLGDRRYATHGPIWKKEMDRLWVAGAIIQYI